MEREYKKAMVIPSKGKQADNFAPLGHKKGPS